MNQPPVSTGRKEKADAIEQAAMAWAARVDRGPLPPEEQAELEDWVAQDIRRAGAFARARATNSYFDRAVALGQDYDPDDHLTTTEVPASNRRRFLTMGGGAIAASLLALLGFASFIRRNRLTTVKGDVRRIALSEGSSITLNSDSAVEPNIDATSRHIRLLQGEALFEVAKDPSRPFIVRAGDVQVRAIGTAFTVRLQDTDAVTVMVQEGIVEVTRAAQSLRLVAGRSTLSTPAMLMVAVAMTNDDIDRALAWRNGMLDLTGLSLAEASAAFARYSDQPIRIDDPAIGALKVTGVYSTSDPRGFAKAAAISLGLTATEDADGIHIGPGPHS